MLPSAVIVRNPQGNCRAATMGAAPAGGRRSEWMTRWEGLLGEGVSSWKREVGIEAEIDAQGIVDNREETHVLRHCRGNHVDRQHSMLRRNARGELRRDDC